VSNSGDAYKEPSTIWKLSNTVSIVEAVLLILEIEPQGVSASIEKQSDHRKPDGYLAARNALASAIRMKAIEGELCHQTYENEQGGGYETDYERIDYHTSTVDVASLVNWLAERGYACSTFAPPNEQSAGFRDPNHPRYAAKLAAVTEAWEEYDESSTEPGTPKQRIAKWLRLNAARFGLTGDDGSPMENVIGDLAKVANWATSGGAPRQNDDEPDPF
jgi:hypothetical protein